MRGAGLVLEVADPSVWDEIEAVVDLAPLVVAELDDCRRALRPGAERAVEPALRERGLSVLRRRPRDPDPSPSERAAPALGPEARRLLYRCQRRAPRGVLLGARAWHPVEDRAAIEELIRSGAIAPLEPDVSSPLGAFRLREDLPPPPEPDWQLEEALFEAPDDLEPPPSRVWHVLSDAAVLAAALRHVTPRRTHQGHLDRQAVRRLGRRLLDEQIRRTGALDRGDPRWRRALDLLEGLDLVAQDRVQRTVHVREPDLSRALDGTPDRVLDGVLRRLCPPELHALLPPLRTALSQAGEQAVDDVLLLELLSEQQDGAFAPDAERFLDDEGPLLDEAIGLLHATGLIVRSPGAFAATDAGRLWAGEPARRPSVWIGSDLELVVPPGAVDPIDRYRVEVLAQPVARDVVDRVRLHRDGLAAWLEGHDVDEAIALLQRLSPAVPATVEDTLRAWASGLTRVVLTPPG